MAQLCSLWHQLKRHNWSQKDPYSKWPIHKADSLGLLLARSLVPLHVGLSANSSQNDDQTPRLRVPREQGRRAWQSVTSIVLHGTRQSQRPAWRRGTDFTSYRGSGMVLVAHVEQERLLQTALKKNKTKKTNTVFQGFPGSPEVKTLSTAENMDVIPGWGISILHGTQSRPKKYIYIYIYKVFYGIA